MLPKLKFLASSGFGLSATDLVTLGGLRFSLAASDALDSGSLERSNAPSLSFHHWISSLQVTSTTHFAVPVDAAGGGKVSLLLLLTVGLNEDVTLPPAAIGWQSRLLIPPAPPNCSFRVNIGLEKFLRS